MIYVRQYVDGKCVSSMEFADKALAAAWVRVEIEAGRMSAVARQKTVGVDGVHSGDGWDMERGVGHVEPDLAAAEIALLRLAACREDRRPSRGDELRACAAALEAKVKAKP